MTDAELENAVRKLRRYVDDYIERVSIGQQLVIPIGNPPGDTKFLAEIIDRLASHYMQTGKWGAGPCSGGTQFCLRLTPR